MLHIEYSLMYNIILKFIHYSITNDDVQWGACTLECRETLRSTFCFTKIELVGAVPRRIPAYSCWCHANHFMH